jgi:hypothetical protein
VASTSAIVAAAHKQFFSEAQIDHFVMAITSAETTVWHSAPHRWFEHGRAYVCADCRDQAVVYRGEAERAAIARPRLGERTQVAEC